VTGAVARAGGEVASSSSVLGLWMDGGLCAAVLQCAPQPRLRLVRPRRVILATGTHAQPPAFEDSDLPGVFAARGLLVALVEHGVLAGKQVAVLGGGPEADAVAARLGSAGMQVAPLKGPPLRAVGRGRVSALELAGGARVDCDTVAVATRRAPAAELARLLGAPLTLDPSGEQLRLSAEAHGRIADGVYAAGEVLGGDGGRPATGSAGADMDAAGAAESGRRAAEAARAEASRG
jgi:sarcosine oxidase subunit alpha